MKNMLRIFLLSMLAMMSVEKINAQQMIVVMNQDYTYNDPRWEDQKVTLEKGQVISVYKEDGTYQYFGGYTAASVAIPERVFHVPGRAPGEKSIYINATHLRLRQGPSTKYPMFCYDADNASSIARYAFRKAPGKQKDEDMTYNWKPYYLDKGTRLPYLGKKNGFYKTTFNGEVFYVSAKYCRLNRR